MIIRLKGNIEKLLPTSVELEVNNVTYYVEIPFLTSVELQNKTSVTLEIAEVFRDNITHYYGFFAKQDKELFAKLIKISGVGVRTALTILSSYSANQVFGILQTRNLAAFKNIKGVGAKVAGKIMIELSDYSQTNIVAADSESRRLANEALIALGFKDAEINKVFQSLTKETLELPTHDLVKVMLQTITKG